MKSKDYIKEFLERKPKTKRNDNLDHPWINAWSKKRAKQEREVRKEISKLGIE